MHIPKGKRNWKLGQRAHAGFLVGYESGNSFRVYLSEQGKVVVTRDVKNDEHWTSESDQTMSEKSSTAANHVEFEDPFHGTTPTEQISSGNAAEVHQAPFTPNEMDEQPETTAVEDSDCDTQDALTYVPGIRRSTRSNLPPDRYGFDHALFVPEARMQKELSRTPLTYQEAISGNDSAARIAAMDEEISQINKQRTWKLVELPKGQKAVRCKWVYTAKRDSQNRITRHRARLVAKGFTQQKVINYEEVFSPVVKYSTIRFLLAMAADEELDMLLLDVKDAFLNGTLDETVFMTQPEGYLNKERRDHVYRLFKAFYGLKQASQARRKVIDKFLRGLGCVQSNADASLYFLKTANGLAFILVYVDDVLLLAKVNALIEQVAIKFQNRFEIRIERNVTKFLGMIIEQDKVHGVIKLHSRTMIDQMLDKFGMDSGRALSNPLAEGISLSVSMGPVDEQEKILMERTPYRPLVGCLLHLANTTRPDIAYAAGYLSRFMQNPRPFHWKAAKHVLR